VVYHHALHSPVRHYGRKLMIHCFQGNTSNNQHRPFKKQCFYLMLSSNTVQSIRDLMCTTVIALRYCHLYNHHLHNSLHLTAAQTLCKLANEMTISIQRRESRTRASTESSAVLLIFHPNAERHQRTKDIQLDKLDIQAKVQATVR